MFKHRVTIRMGEVLGNPLTIIGLSTSCIDLMAVKITTNLIIARAPILKSVHSSVFDISSKGKPAHCFYLTSPTE